LRISAQLQAPSGHIIEAVRQLGLEGVIGKRIDSVYEPGERSGAWIKHRTNNEQEFVVGGYIPDSHAFDALLVGVYENKRLMFVAKAAATRLSPHAVTAIHGASRQRESSQVCQSSIVA
jgi:ATP-dependent DNA ligase